MENMATPTWPYRPIRTVRSANFTWEPGQFFLPAESIPQRVMLRFPDPREGQWWKMHLQFTGMTFGISLVVLTVFRLVDYHFSWAFVIVVTVAMTLLGLIASLFISLSVNQVWRNQKTAVLTIDRVGIDYTSEMVRDFIAWEQISTIDAELRIWGKKQKVPTRQFPDHKDPNVMLFNTQELSDPQTLLIFRLTSTHPRPLRYNRFMPFTGVKLPNSDHNVGFQMPMLAPLGTAERWGLDSVLSAIAYFAGRKFTGLKIVDNRTSFAEIETAQHKTA
jgi:hypothetical protein